MAAAITKMHLLSRVEIGLVGEHRKDDLVRSMEKSVRTLCGLNHKSVVEREALEHESSSILIGPRHL